MRLTGQQVRALEGIDMMRDSRGSVTMEILRANGHRRDVIDRLCAMRLAYATGDYGDPDRVRFALTREGVEMLPSAAADAELKEAAEKLRAAGYVVVEPDDLTYREAIDRLNDQHYAIRRQIDTAMAAMGLAMRKFTVLVDPGHELINAFYRVADQVRELQAELRILRRIHKRARPMRQCRGCGRAGGELTENGCPACGPDADIS